MMRDLVLDTAPATDLVTLAEAREHLRLDGVTDHDERVSAAIASAMGQLDGPAGILGRALVEQTWIYYLNRFPVGPVVLPLPPLISVDSITYLNTAGVRTTLAASNYQVLDGQIASVRPAWDKSWPATRLQPRSVAITFTCGYAAPSGSEPWPSALQPVRSAIKLMVENEFTGEDTSRTQAIERLLRPVRVPRL